MNKHATVLHWIVFGVLAAFGIFFVASYDIQTIEPRGIWHLSYVNAFQEAEKNLLIIDQKVKSALESTELNLQKSVFSQDLGCGMYQNAALLNKNGHFCPLKLEEKLTEGLTKKLAEEKIWGYDSFFIDGEYVVGKSVVGKGSKNKITIANEVIPTKPKSTLFASYQVYLIEPFYLEYNYNPSFRIKANSLNWYGSLQNEAINLVLKCQNEAELKNCLDKNKKSNWKYTSCEQEKYSFESRKIFFCLASEKGKLNFALDFSPVTVFAPTDIKVSSSMEVFTISFNHEPEAESYKVYYTNWKVATEKVPATSEEIFFDLPTAEAFGYFYKAVDVDIPAVENCLTPQVGQANLCNGRVLYTLKDDRLKQK
ncbi:hypothetical protein HZC32_02850 [Candidatus Woesearchaeota archaeon]|nr:hypothetical protein [Candidatus Woesearchaeota archaeon]